MPKTYLSNKVKGEDFFLIDDAFRRQQAVADKALFPKGSEEDWFETRSVRFSCIYPRHWYSESLN